MKLITYTTPDALPDFCIAVSRPLNRLLAKTTFADASNGAPSVAELADKIATHGLPHFLVANVSNDGFHHDVLVGKHLLEALRLLAKRGVLAEDACIPCIVLDGNGDQDEYDEIPILAMPVRLGTAMTA